MKTAFSLLLAVAIAVVPTHANRCESKENGATLPSPDSCEAYVLCFNQMEINLECPAEHWYDMVSNSCLPQADAKCYMLMQGAQCPDQGLASIPHPDSCERYFICYDGERIERSCFEGLHWNAEQEQCMEPRLAGCEKKEELSCPQVSVPGEVVFLPNPSSCTR
jgi:Chitin binding Peritrophin-A domain